MTDTPLHTASPILAPPVMATPRLYLTDARRASLTPLQLAQPYDLSVVCNPDAEHTRIATLGVVNPDAIRPLVDYLYLDVFLRDPYGQTMTVPLGHYLCDVPERVYDGRALAGTVTGYGGTLALAQATMPGGYVLEAGTDPAVALVDVMAATGVPRSMIAVPPSGIPATEERHWSGGDTAQRIATDLAAMIAYYAPWPDGFGILRSEPYRDYGRVPVVGVWGTAPGQLEILDRMVGQRSWMTMRNRITVRRVGEGQDPIIATAEITDYSHPLHPVRLQEARNAPMPVILAETIDDGMVETYEAALAKARNTLAERASRYDTARAVTVLDAHPDAHQVIELDVRHGINPVFAGRWRRRAWTYRQRGPEATLDVDLARTVA